MSVMAPEIMKETMVRKDLQLSKEEKQKHKARWGSGAKELHICLERGRLITESYKETEGEPEVLRRAKALAHILENMSIYIRDGERIVGNFASDEYGLPFMPELATEWVAERVNEELYDMLDEEGHQEFNEIMGYWRDKCIDARVKALLPDYLKDYIKWNGLAETEQYQIDRVIAAVNFKKVLEVGLEGIIAQAEERLNTLRKDVPEGPEVGDWSSQIEFLEAVIISLRGAINFAHRFSNLARKIAEKGEKPERREELLEIAEICERVPAKPARTLHEALQSFWFTYLITDLIETTAHGIGIRFDVVMNPYYQADKEAGRLNYEKALELVKYLWVKIEETGQLLNRAFHGAGPGTTLYQSFTIGGVDENNEDASNEFSFIILDASKDLHTCQTNIPFRFHPKINHELVLKAIDVIRTGVGYPSIFNDSTIIPWGSSRGLSLKEARDYVIVSCVNWGIPGKVTKGRVACSGSICMGKCLELALNQGKDPYTGKQLGPVTPDPLTFKSIDDVKEAFFTQVDSIIEKLSKINNVALDVYRQYGQRPFASSLFDGCIERGMDCTAWKEKYSYNWMYAAGNTNVADSLAAMKKLIFEDKVISMEELLGALRDNFEGKEELRLKLLNEAPKFGNDDDYVDSIMREVQHGIQKVAEEYVDIFGVSYSFDGSIAAGYYTLGRRTGALPDGKKRKESFADAVMSPAAGRDTKGPTAVIKSMGKVTPTWPFLANQKFMPQFLEGDNRELFAAYLKTWAELGNWHIQFNVIDRDTLLDAQRNPEEYYNLVVRVAGYSAYFVDLPKGVQDDIIARAAQSF